jgi:hypothetical protein
MHEELNYNIVKIEQEYDSAIYKIGEENAYIVSHSSTRELLCNPEVIGYDIPQKLLLPIKDVLLYLNKMISLDNINIVNILRGGLNFPIEEACFNNGVTINEISFLTSERIFLDNKVSRIESKYQKIANVPNSTIIIGDIIASGETFYNTIKYLVEKYVYNKNRISKIVVFTIGTNNALNLIRKLEYELKERWSDFQGIYVVFFEAVFTTYTSCGITKLNLPHVDFTFKNGILAPEYRKNIFEQEHIIFEKCAIYDGGARRFEKNLHINDVVGYWKNLCSISDKINIKELYNEKIGYGLNGLYPDLFEWVKLNNYEELIEEKVADVYCFEKSYYGQLQQTNMYDIAMNRYKNLVSYYHI